jgi:hypothetical protein
MWLPFSSWLITVGQFKVWGFATLKAWKFIKSVRKAMTRKSWKLSRGPQKHYFRIAVTATATVTVTVTALQEVSSPIRKEKRIILLACVLSQRLRHSTQLILYIHSGTATVSSVWRYLLTGTLIPARAVYTLTPTPTLPRQRSHGPTPTIPRWRSRSHAHAHAKFVPPTEKNAAWFGSLHRADWDLHPGARSFQGLLC